jgi:outer membrane protein assembly factor BamB
MNPFLLLAFTISIVSVSVLGSDWPQYLGPERNAVSAETGLLRSWPAGGPEVLWTVPLGPGFGGAAVSDNAVFVLDRAGDTQDVLRCYSLATGKEQWKYGYTAPGKTSFPGSRSVPAIDGKYVYTCGPFGDVHCFDATTQKPVWHKNVWKDFGGDNVPRWGISQSPLIMGNLLILASQTKQAGVVAYNKKMGDVVWKTPAFPGNAGYVSPKIVTISGKEQIIMISGAPRSRRRRGDRQRGNRRPRQEGREGRPPRSLPQEPGEKEKPAEKAQPAKDDTEATPPEPPKGVVAGIDPKNGAILWTYDGWQCSIPIPNVTAVGDNRFFITAGYNAGSAMIKVEKKDKTYTVKELFKTMDFGTHVHPAILYKDHLYAHCTDNSRKDGMGCISLDGTVKWKTKKDPVFDKGGFILADGLLFSVDGVQGILYLVEPNPKEFKKLAEVKLLDTQQCWAPLALSNGKLLIRDQKQMKCVNVKTTPAGKTQMK